MILIVKIYIKISHFIYSGKTGGPIQTRNLNDKKFTIFFLNKLLLKLSIDLYEL